MLGTASLHRLSLTEETVYIQSLFSVPSVGHTSTFFPLFCLSVSAVMSYPVSPLSQNQKSMNYINPKCQFSSVSTLRNGYMYNGHSFRSCTCTLSLLTQCVDFIAVFIFKQNKIHSSENHVVSKWPKLFSPRMSNS